MKTTLCKSQQIMEKNKSELHAENIKEFINCGEIFVTIEGNGKTLALNCLFCPTTYLILEDFGVHLEQHTEDLKERIKFISENEINKICSNQPDEGDDDIENVGIELDTVNEIEPDDEDNDNHIDDEEEIIEENYETSDGETVDTTLNDAAEEENGDRGEQEEKHSEQFSGEGTQTLSFITAWKREPILWDPNQEYTKCRRRRRNAYNRIIDYLKDEINLEINHKDIGYWIRTLRHKYKKELQNIETAASGDQPYTPVWYFDKLSFLHCPKLKDKREVTPIFKKRKQKFVTKHRLSDIQYKQLLEIYKNFPCLWDVENIEYRFDSQRQQNLNELLEHVRFQMNLNNFTKDDLQVELKSLHSICSREKERKLICEEKNRENFIPNCTFYNQLLYLQPNVPPFPCPFCGKKIMFIDHYRSHKAEHDGSKPFICSICNKGFKDSGNFKVHLRRHRGDHPFECKICGKSYPSSTERVIHMRFHTGEKPYCCEICGKAFSTCSQLCFHKRRHETTKNFKCPACSKSFYENAKLQIHMKIHQNIRNSVCDICSKAFTTSSLLRQHKQIHEVNKRFVCSICSKTFSQCAGLANHMKMHCNEENCAMLVEEIDKD